MTELIPVLVLLPLVGVVVTALTPARVARVLGTAWTAAVAALAVLLAVAVWQDGPVSLVLGGWDVPIGIGLRVDGLAAAMLLLTGLVGTVVCVFATASEAVAGNRWFWPLWLFLLAGLNAVFVSGDLFNTYVALELVTIAAVALVALGGDDALRPALRYLFVAVLGSLAFLVVVALVYAHTGTLALDDATGALPSGPVLLTVLGLAIVGLGLKTALFPMHTWLPPAHAGAPSAVSPLMSALVIKASLYVLIRMWTGLAGDDATEALGQLLGAVGVAAVLWGSFLALRQTHLKRLVAYSTVAQVGSFFLIFPLVTPGLRADATPEAIEAARLAWQGALVLVLAHGLAKAAMFLGAGTLKSAYGSDALTDLRGAVGTHPVAVIAFGLAGVCLAGLPPTFAFVGKWQLLWASLESGQWWWIPVLLVGGLLTFAYTAKALWVMIHTEPIDSAEPRWDTVAPVPIPARMQWTTFVLALLAFVLGLHSIEILELLDVGTPWEVPL